MSPMETSCGRLIQRPSSWWANHSHNQQHSRPVAYIRHLPAVRSSNTLQAIWASYEQTVLTISLSGVLSAPIVISLGQKVRLLPPRSVLSYRNSISRSDEAKSRILCVLRSRSTFTSSTASLIHLAARGSVFRRKILVAGRARIAWHPALRAVLQFTCT